LIFNGLGGFWPEKPLGRPGQPLFRLRRAKPPSHYWIHKRNGQRVGLAVLCRSSSWPWSRARFRDEPGGLRLCRSASCPNSQRVEKPRAVRPISTPAGLPAGCGLGQTALRERRQHAQLAGHEFFERVGGHNDELNRNKFYGSKFTFIFREPQHRFARQHIACVNINFKIDGRLLRS